MLLARAHWKRGGRCSGEDLAIFASAGQKMSSLHVPEKPYAKSVIFSHKLFNFFQWKSPLPFFIFGKWKMFSLLVPSICKCAAECQETSAKIYVGSGFSDNRGLFLFTLRKYLFQNTIHKVFKHLPKALFIIFVCGGKPGC